MISTVMADRIPFNRPSMVGRELDYIQQALANSQLAGDGPFTHRCNALIRADNSLATSGFVT